MIGAALLALLRKLAAPLLAVIVGLLLGTMAYQWVKTSNTINGLEHAAANAEQRRAEAVTLLLEARKEGQRDLDNEMKRNADIERAWQLAYDKAEEVRRNEIAVLKKYLDDAAVERKRVYDTTRETYRAVTSAKPGSSTVVGGSDATAQAFGELLIRSDGVSESLGIQAEGLAAQVRGLQAEVKALEGAR